MQLNGGKAVRSPSRSGMQKRRRRHALGQRGYSLVEILVATSLSAVALVAFTAFNRFQLFALRNQATQIDLQTTARSVLDLIAREVRRAGMDPTCGKAFEGVASGNSTQVRIKQDLNSNGTIDGTNENILYRYNLFTNQVERVTATGTDVLLSGYDMSGSELMYFDSDGVRLVPGSTGLTTAQRAAVRRIRIELALEDEDYDPLTAKQLRAEVSTDIDLRNRFFINSTVCP